MFWCFKVLRCFNVLMFSLFQCSPMFWCFSMFQCFNVAMFQCFNVAMFSRSDLTIRTLQKNIGIHIKDAWSHIEIWVFILTVQSTTPEDSLMPLSEKRTSKIEKSSVYKLEVKKKKVLEKLCSKRLWILRSKLKCEIKRLRIFVKHKPSTFYWRSPELYSRNNSPWRFGTCDDFIFLV